MSSARAAAIAAFASPIILPNDAFSSGDSEPRPRLASEMGALSPVWANRAALSSSRSSAAAKADLAALTHSLISCGFMS